MKKVLKVFMWILIFLGVLGLAILMASIPVNTNWSWNNAPQPQYTIPADKHKILEDNGIQNCQVNPVHSYFTNQKTVIVGNQAYSVTCDPMYEGLSRCCYN